MEKKRRKTNYNIMLRQQYGNDFIQLVADMQQGGTPICDIIDTMAELFPNAQPLTKTIIEQIVNSVKGNTLRMRNENVGEVFRVWFDKEIADFLHSLPYNPSTFVNTVMGIYLREYKLKKAQQEALDNEG